MSIIYLGDCHGRLSSVDKIVQSAEARDINYIVQVGDLGCMWPGPRDALDKWIAKRAYRGWKTELLTCGGNHDNWELFDRLAEEQGGDKIELYPGSGVYYIRRGALLELDGVSHLFLGGAESTDKQNRVEGRNLWEAREEPSESEFQLFRERLNDLKPNTVVTHEAPLRVSFKRKRRKSSTTPRMLEKIINSSEHMPRKWYFGHHHTLEKWKVGGVKYYCCGLHGEYWSRE